MSIQTLLEMFSYQRPMGSRTETLFIAKYLDQFEADAYGNLVLTIGDNPRILFSSHMDTVHFEDGFNHSIKFDGQFMTQTEANCLGADDTAGVWLMLEMIEANIPGVYVIHYGEERGCVGSKALARGNPDFFRDIKMAIAFDRMGYEDIITHQCSRRTASDAFANSLAKELGDTFKPCSQGVYTDTAEYGDLVPECTNISVGYFGQHTKNEKQDVKFLLALRDALLQVNWDNLIVERDPTVEEWDDHWAFWGGSSKKSNRRQQGYQTMEDLVWEYPDVAYDLLQAWGVHREEFLQAIEERHGIYHDAA